MATKPKLAKVTVPIRNPVIEDLPDRPIPARVAYPREK